MSGELRKTGSAVRSFFFVGMALFLASMLCAARAEGVSGTCSVEGVEVSIAVANRWESDGRFYYQYDITAENRTDQPVDDWSAAIAAEPCEVVQQWNCEAAYGGGAIAVRPLDYARAIAPGQTVTGVGLIVAFGERQPEATTVPATPRPRETSTARPEPGDGGADAAAATSISGGRLSVSQGRLVDEDGQMFQIQGVSTHGIGWFPEYVNIDAFRTLRDAYGVNAIRIAMYTAEYNGYCTGGDPEQLRQLVDRGVACATELGMYAIIDWHTLSDSDPNQHLDEAREFWREMSRKYAGQDNVLYEICNEPNGDTSWASVKAYAEAVIAEIRENDEDAVILVGTPNWCQQLSGPLSQPIEDANLMYTMHFYAATHRQELRDELERALQQGLPVFISECSICDASGSGDIDYDSADAWLELIDRYRLSHVAWNLSNKDESAALIRSDCTKLSGWTEDELSATGKWFLAEFRR